MALQGTLDTFALPDVLRLLASTKKTGRLVITGARGNGSVWVDGGSVVGTEASGAMHDADAVAILFELLRFGGDGSFTFEAGTTSPEPASARAVEPLLIDAERQLAEWREIEAVVPSMDAWITLVDELAAAEITVSAERWKRVVAIGSGATVSAVAQALRLGELDVCRGVKELVELGLAEVGPERGGSARTVDTATGSGTSWDPFSIDIPGVAPVTTSETTEPALDEESAEALAPVVEMPVLSVVDDRDDRDAYDDDTDEPVFAVDDDEMADADEVARQLASLSPKAARAVAAAAKASSDEERDAALAEASEDDEEPINRGLLLKFLSSVKS